MRRRTIWVLCALLQACPLMDDGGGGGGGGGDEVRFTRGYVFVRSDDRNLYVADDADLTRASPLTTTGDVRHPSLSRDGREVVFVRVVGGGTELVTVPTTGGAVAALRASSVTERNYRHPVFSPDGSRIVFAYDEGVSSSLGVINADGSGFAKLIGGTSLAYSSPSFYPDGASVLAIAGSPGVGYTMLEQVNLSSRVPTPVTNTLGNEVLGIAQRAVLSPDGARVAFDGRLSTGGSRVFILSLSSKAVTRVTDYPADLNAQDSFPTWVGTSKIGFASDTGGDDAVYALPATAEKTSGGLVIAGATEPWYGP